MYLISFTVSSESSQNRNFLFNDAQLSPSVATLVATTPTTTAAVAPFLATTPTTANGLLLTPAGDGNVLKKVASFTVERTNFDNTTSSKISRPSYVPEKLNFGAYEKFEGKFVVIGWTKICRVHISSCSITFI